MNPFTNAKVVAAGYDPEKYHRQDAKRGDKSFVMSRGELMTFAACPQKWLRGYRQDATDSTEFGTLMDVMFLDHGQLENRFAVQPERYKTTGMECPVCKSVTDSKKCAACKTERVEIEIEKDWSGQSNTCKEWVKTQETAGRTVISIEDKQRAVAANTRLAQDPLVHEYFCESETQVYCTADYADKATGLVIPFKILIDLVPDKSHPDFGRSLADYKTDRNAAPHAWQRTVFQRGYHVQGAVYLDVFTAATGEDRVEFRHIVQENIAPFEVARRLLDAEYVEIGRQQYIAALRKYCRCLASNVWPGFDDEDETGRAILDGWRLVNPEPWMVNP